MIQMRADVSCKFNLEALRARWAREEERSELEGAYSSDCSFRDTETRDPDKSWQHEASI